MKDISCKSEYTYSRIQRLTAIAIQIEVGMLDHEPLMEAIEILLIQAAPDQRKAMDYTVLNSEAGNV